MLAAGLHPTQLARPPYGAVDGRARRMVAKLGYTPVLWTVDSRDWAGGTPRQIREKVLGAVRPHRTNVVLLHDGVTNSPATLRALPDEITTLRKRGYCFAGLDARGHPTPPVPVPTVSTDVRRTREGGTVRVSVTLDRPTSRPTVVPWRAGRLGSCASPVGDTVARLRLSVPHDRLDESPEALVLRAGASSTSVLVGSAYGSTGAAAATCTCCCAARASTGGCGCRPGHSRRGSRSPCLQGPSGVRYAGSR